MQEGYRTQQATKPQTLSYTIMDSPVGIAAWLVEKFKSWSDLDGGDIESVYSKDDLLTNIMGFVTTRGYIKRLYNVQKWTEMMRGGHFAAMEQPGLLIDDIRRFARTLRDRTSGAP